MHPKACGDSMPIAIATMVYNERVNLPIWIRHDRAQCPGAHLVIDHGSDDGSTDGLADVTVITLPRTPLDEAGRVRIVEGVQRDLLLDHAVVICTDCDEILLADPQRHASLAAFLDAVPDDFIAPAGVHVLHDFETEPALDPSAPILAQRRFVEFGSGMCKPMIGRVPLAWDVGFHGSDQRPAYRPDLIHFHLGDVDRDIALHRLALTRAITWSDASLAAGHSFHQRASDHDYLQGSFIRPIRAIRRGVAQPFDFTEELDRLNRVLAKQNGFWLPSPHFRGRIAEIPEAMRHAL